MRTHGATSLLGLGLLLASAGCGSSAPESPAPAAAGPTYYQDVAPILSAKCNGCHAEGGIAPFALSTFEEASTVAGMIQASTSAGTMPPWPPGPASPAMLHDRRLDEAQIALIDAWVEAGAPEGDPDHPAPLTPPEAVDIGDTEINTDIGADYVPDSSVTDDYHCFIVELGLAEDRIATGFRITPGNGKIVHHVTTSLYTAESKPVLEARDADTPEPGFSCFGGVANIQGADAIGSIGAWVPGTSAVKYPAGTGVAIRAGAVAVLQVHYNLAGGTDPDRTRLEVALASSEEGAALQRLSGIGLGVPGLYIPAGAERVEEVRTRTATEWAGGEFFPDGEGFVVGVGGHMHVLGVEVSLTLTNQGGTQTLLDIPAWDFHWQGTYDLVEPMVVRPDDELTIRCVYDNSEAHRMANGLGQPVDVTWGEGTLDEMCLGSLRMVDDPPAGP